MEKIILLARSALFIFLLAHLSHGKEWRGIVPLHSTRNDVQKVMGPSERSGDVYNLANEVVLISYSTGSCSQGGVWNVPRDTVERITVSPKKTLSLAELRVDVSKYQTIADKHLQGIIYYNNAEEGVHIQTYQDKITSIAYLPAASDNHLRCRTSSVGPPLTKTGKSIDSHTLFDSYGQIPFDLEKRRLDFLGRRLENVPGSRVYIVTYSGPRVSIRQALSRANRAKKYLISTYKLSESSIEILNGGQLSEFSIRLYLDP